MSDVTINRYLGQGDDAAEAAWAAVPPDPSTAVTIPENAVLFVNTEDPANPILKYWDGAAFVEFPSSGGTGNVSAAGTLTDHAIVLGDGSTDVTVVASLGTSTTVLHGAAAGDPTWGAVALGTDVSGDLPFANLTQIAGLSVLGVTGSSTADVAAITAGSDGHVLTRVSSSSLAFAAPSGGGGLVLVEQHTASGGASLDFTTGITSTYDDYVIEIMNVNNASSDAGLWMLVSFDGGANWQSSNYEWMNRWQNNVNSQGVNTNVAQAKFIVWDTMEATSGAGVNASIKMFNPLGAQRYKMWTYAGVADQADAHIYSFTGSLHFISTSAINAIQFKMSTGNVDTGVIRLYGLAK